jgi:hypothetical protein
MDEQDILHYNGTPYVAYRDYANSYKATVMKFDGTDREVVDHAGFSDGQATYTSLAVYNGLPYVAYGDYANSYKATVMKFDVSTDVDCDEIPDVQDNCLLVENTDQANSDYAAMTFTKANYADPTDQANQDCITDNVCLTR